MSNAFDRFFGGPPVRTVVWLVLLSLVVGFVLHTFRLDPFTLVEALVDAVRETIRAISHLGLDAFRWAGRYIVYGAVIVVPLWLLSRLFASGRDQR